MTAPGVGETVHYVSSGSKDGKYLGRHVALVVCEVWANDVVSGWSLHPLTLRYELMVPHDETGKPSGTWHWPERED